MKLDYKLFKKMVLPIGILSLLCFGLRIYTYWKELEIPSGFFSGNGAGCFVYNLIGFIVFFLCLMLTLRKSGSSVGSATSAAPTPTAQEDDSLLMQEENLYAEEQDFPQYFLQGFAKKCAIWYGTFSAFAALLPGFALICHALSYVVNEDFSDPYNKIYLLLSAASGAFFLYYAIRNSCERSRFLAFFSLVPSFWCTFRMIVEYRDLTHFINKSLYVGQFLFIISAMVFLLHQAQILLGEDNLSRPNGYVFSGLSTVFFGLTARLPHLIAIMGERINTDLFTSTALLADLALTLFVASKLKVTAKRK
ncbi:MAG: hypothetical protein E7580_08440 [Ruminococcaceae bacterium]|nr:hypothetical protein [Oscillospiraceae bacterium]